VLPSQVRDDWTDYIPPPPCHFLYALKKRTEDVEVSGKADRDYDFPKTVKAH